MNRFATEKGQIDEEKNEKIYSKSQADEDEEEKQMNLMELLKICFIIVSLCFILVMLFHRNSRPKELYSTFGVFDEYLKRPQEALDSLFEAREPVPMNPKEIDIEKVQKNARRKDQKYLMELIELRLNYEKLKKPPPTATEAELKYEDRMNFWKTQNLALESEIAELKIQKMKLAKEYDGMMDTKKSMKSKLEAANMKVFAAIANINSLDFSLFSMDDFDREAQGIIKNIFNSSVLFSFAKNLSNRSNSMKNVLKAIRESDSKLRVENYRISRPQFDWLTASQAEGLINSQLKLENIMPVDYSKWSPFDIEKIKTDPANIAYMKVLHSLEAEMFKISARNWDFSNRVGRIDNHLIFLHKFMDVSSSLKKTEDAFIRKWAQLIVRKQGEMISSYKKATLPSNEISYSLAMSWHKRKVYEMVTSCANLFTDHQKLLQLDLISQFSDSYLKWIKATKQSAMSFKNESMNDFLQPKKKMGESAKSFILEVKFSVDYFKNGHFSHLKKMISTGILAQKYSFWISDGFIFALSSVFADLNRMDDNVTQALIDNWPNSATKLKIFMADDVGELAETIKSIAEN